MATSLSALLLFAFSSLFFQNAFHASDWMAASPEAVFGRGEYWRLWTALFAHADLGHLLSNAVLFVPLAYALSGHYSFWLFPLGGFALGGLTNYLVLLTMPEQSSLIGVSGMVYWMGASWLTLYLLIDRRERLKRRFGGALFLTLILFVPETLKPEVSHLSHFLGYVIGVFTALLYYAWNRRMFIDAERYVLVYPDPDQYPRHSYDYELEPRDNGQSTSA